MSKEKTANISAVNSAVSLPDAGRRTPRACEENRQDHLQSDESISAPPAGKP